MLNKINAGVLALFTLMATSFPALAQQAQTWDASAVTTEINGAKPIIIAVGLAMLGAVALIVGYRLVRKITG